MTTGTKLKALLADRGWRPPSLQKIAGVSRTTTYNWCNDVNRPSMEAALHIARAFDVSVDYLMDDAIEEKPKPKELTPDEYAVLVSFRGSGLTADEAAEWITNGVKSKASEGKPTVATHGQSKEEPSKGRRKEG